MRHALALAERGLGQVWPNPAVGCVIVQGGVIVGRGWTQPGGRPHAETVALAQAGDRARGATVYVTLEPCAHQGQTPPCVDALIAAGVGRLVAACIDPDPRVAGQGLERARQAGMTVEEGLCAQEARLLNAGFMRRVTAGRPYVTLKLATTLDGRIALKNGQSQWITSEAARRDAHGLRARHDAILTGSGTVVTDDPMLNVRLDGYRGRQPWRVIADTHLRTPLTARIIASAPAQKTILLHDADVDGRRKQAFADCGVVLEPVAVTDHQLRLDAMMERLAGMGLTRLLVESGGRLAATMLGAGLVDEIYHYQAPGVIGGDGIPAVAALGLEKLGDMPGFTWVAERRLGPDRLAILRKAG